MAAQHPEPATPGSQRAQAQTPPRTGAGGPSRQVSGGAEELIRLRWLLLVWSLWAAPVALAEPVLRLLTDADWSLDQPWFGGFSGIEVTDQGDAATLITDKGMLVQVTFHRNDGR